MGIEIALVGPNVGCARGFQLASRDALWRDRYAPSKLERLFTMCLAEILE
jgi:hypothetical protein